MDKLTIATQVLLKLIETDKTEFDAEGIAGYAWEITDAMQAEADKRKPSGLPEALKEEWQPDWNQAPKGQPVTGWYIFKGVAHWISDDFPCGPAPSFGFTNSHIVERPHGF